MSTENKELSKEEKVQNLVSKGFISLALVAAFSKLSSSDLDAFTEFSLEKEQASFVVEKVEQVVEDKVQLTEEQEKELLETLKEKYPVEVEDVVEVDQEEPSEKYKKIVIENRELKQKQVNASKVLAAAKAIIQECSK